MKRRGLQSATVVTIPFGVPQPIRNAIIKCARILKNGKSGHSVLLIGISLNLSKHIQVEYDNKKCAKNANFV